MPPVPLFLASVLGLAEKIQLLAHQGGWDEILMVAAPVGVFAMLLYRANNQASKLEGEESETDDPSADKSHHQPRNPRSGPM